MQQAERLKNIQAHLSKVTTTRVMGRVTSVNGGVITASGLDQEARIGDRAEIKRHDGTSLLGEVIQVSKAGVIVLPDGTVSGVGCSDSVILRHNSGIAPDNSWVGRIIDPDGNPLDERQIGRAHV